jgi:hypothetical protein
MSISQVLCIVSIETLGNTGLIEYTGAGMQGDQMIGKNRPNFEKVSNTVAKPKNAKISTTYLGQNVIELLSKK